MTRDSLYPQMKNSPEFRIIKDFRYYLPWRLKFSNAVCLNSFPQQIAARLYSQSASQCVISLPKTVWKTLHLHSVSNLVLNTF